ncbi:MAG: NAD(P)-binding protein, partial [Sphingomonadales bacterium]|nr:NAD(P)-binding protein [Sphingomonadales bacterium]
MNPIHPSSAPDMAWLATAVGAANVPTLACVLVQLTGDRRWIEPPYVPTRTRGLEDNDDGGLPEAIQQEIKAAALTALADWFAGKRPVLPNPSDDLLLEIMSITLGERIPAEYAPIIRHELQLVPEPGITAPPPPGFSALIIGAGISGLCAAMAFHAAGIPYTIVERRESLGGVWFENRYPGAACDVPSHLYSFSTEPYPWSRYFAGSR